MSTLSSMTPQREFRAPKTQRDLIITTHVQLAQLFDVPIYKRRINVDVTVHTSDDRDDPPFDLAQWKSALHDFASIFAACDSVQRHELTRQMQRAFARLSGREL